MKYISQIQLLEYLEQTIMFNDIKDKTQRYDKSTYKNTNLYDFVKSMETINFVKDFEPQLPYIEYTNKT